MDADEEDAAVEEAVAVRDDRVAGVVPAAEGAFASCLFVPWGKNIQSSVHALFNRSINLTIVILFFVVFSAGCFPFVVFYFHSIIISLSTSRTEAEEIAVAVVSRAVGTAVVPVEGEDGDDVVAVLPQEVTNRRSLHHHYIATWVVTIISLGLTIF